MDIYFEGLTILISLSLFALMVFKSFSVPYTIINFLFASLKLPVLILKMLTETLLRFPISVISRCF
jgi:hypothetical protein